MTGKELFVAINEDAAQKCDDDDDDDQEGEGMKEGKEEEGMEEEEDKEEAARVPDIVRKNSRRRCSGAFGDARGVPSGRL